MRPASGTPEDRERGIVVTLPHKGRNEAGVWDAGGRSYGRELPTT